MFNFDAHLQKGAESAKKYKKSIVSLNEIFDSFKVSIEGFLNIDIKLKKVKEVVTDYSCPPTTSFFSALPEFPTETTGFLIYKLCYDKNEINAFKYRLSDEVFPVTLERKNVRYIAEDSEELESVLAEYASQADFHLDLDNLIE